MHKKEVKKVVKVKVVEEFHDITADKKLRKVNEELEVSEKRAQKLEGLGLVKRIPESTKKEEKKAMEKG